MCGVKPEDRVSSDALCLRLGITLPQHYEADTFGGPAMCSVVPPGSIRSKVSRWTAGQEGKLGGVHVFLIFLLFFLQISQK